MLALLLFVAAVSIADAAALMAVVAVGLGLANQPVAISFCCCCFKRYASGCLALELLPNSGRGHNDEVVFACWWLAMFLFSSMLTAPN